MCELNENEIDGAITQLEQDLRAMGWQPVELTEPTTRTPFTRWFPPGKPVPSMYREFVGDNDVNNNDDEAAESGEPAAYFLDREFYSDNMDFPPNFDNGPNPLGEDY